MTHEDYNKNVVTVFEGKYTFHLEGDILFLDKKPFSRCPFFLEALAATPEGEEKAFPHTKRLFRKNEKKAEKLAAYKILQQADRNI